MGAHAYEIRHSICKGSHGISWYQCRSVASNSGIVLLQIPTVWLVHIHVFCYGSKSETRQSEEPTLIIKRGNGKSLQMEVVVGKWTVIKFWEIFHSHVWIREGTSFALDFYFQRRESWSWCSNYNIWPPSVWTIVNSNWAILQSCLNCIPLALRSCQSFPSCRWRVASMPISFTPGLWGPASTKSSAWRVFQASGTMSWTKKTAQLRIHIEGKL